VAKLTKAQREALQWFAERDPVSLFGRWAPTRVTRNRLEAAGLIERKGDDRMGFVAFGISEAGRAALTSGASDHV
jgi:hypothetical protein